MGNIKKTILGIIIPRSIKRIKRLKEMRAPQVIIEGSEKGLKKRQKGDISHIKHIEKFQDLEVDSWEEGKGRGGKHFFIFKVGERSIYWFPEGKWGQFITELEGK